MSTLQHVLGDLILPYANFPDKPFSCPECNTLMAQKDLKLCGGCKHEFWCVRQFSLVRNGRH